MLENTPEYKEEKIIIAQDKKIKNEPIDRRCLDAMRMKYSEQNMR